MEIMAIIANDNKSHISKAEIERVVARLILIIMHKGIVNNKQRASAIIFLLFNFLKIR